MALPKVNELPKYEVIIPSTNKKTRFRPYLVKEEKTLMMAFETGDETTALDAVIETINVCLDDPIKDNKYTSYDIEYLILKIRSKSVGETINLNVKCKECEHASAHSILIDDIQVKKPDVDKLIKLTDQVSLEMKFPSLDDLKGMNNRTTKTEDLFKMVTKCIEAIVTENERISAADETEEDLLDFLDNLTAAQFKLLSDFLKGVPKLSHDIKFKCEKCEKDNKITVEGLQSFFI